jgi:hypothetical protein
MPSHPLSQEPRAAKNHYHFCHAVYSLRQNSLIKPF